MVTKFNFTYEGISHFSKDGKFINTTYHYVVYPCEKDYSYIGNILNSRFSTHEGTKTKKMIENQITWAFESCGRKVQSITFDDKYKGCEYNTLIHSDFTCTIDYTY